MSVYSLKSDCINIHVVNGFIKDIETDVWHNIRHVKEFYIQRAYGNNYRDPHKILAKIDDKEEFLVGTVSQWYCPNSRLDDLIRFFNTSLKSVEKHFDDFENTITSIPTKPEQPRKSKIHLPKTPPKSN